MGSLNCKPGDLARVIDSGPSRNLGVVDAIVKVLEVDPVLSVRAGALSWKIDPIPCRCCRTCDGMVEGIADKLLRPIRDQPGEDETLTWAPSPTKQLEQV